MFKPKLRYALLLLAAFTVVLCAVSIEKMNEQKEVTLPASSLPPAVHERYAGVFADFQKHIFDTEIFPANWSDYLLTPEESSSLVYSFLQGPRSYGDGLPWAGDWSEKVVSGRTFGGFGCGFCCMANIYSTLTDYECSPWDLFEYATTVTNYYPSAESGAIDWPAIRRTLRATGFQCKYYKKPATYEEFQEQIRRSQSAIVLVSSANDSTFWKDTAGHYVNIWLYQNSTDMVFLTEPGSPENNRTWIPLRYVYDALKTANRYQFLTVTAYSEEENTWKGTGMDDIWNGKY